MSGPPESHASPNSERQLRFGELVLGLAVALKERMHHLKAQARLASGHLASNDDRPADMILSYDNSGFPMLMVIDRYSFNEDIVEQASGCSQLRLSWSPPL